MQVRYQAALRPDIKDWNITRKFFYFQETPPIFIPSSLSSLLLQKGTNISIDPFELAHQSYFLFHKKGAMCVNDCCCDLGTFIPIVKVGLCPGNGGTAKRGLSICPTAAGFSRCTFD